MRLAPLLLLLSCHAQLAADAVTSLEGLTFSLAPSPGVRLQVEGSLDGEPVLVKFDPASPMSFVSQRCAKSAPIFTRVTLADAFGPAETYSVSHVENLVIGGTRFHSFNAALAGGSACVVVLGAPELKGLAIEVQPSTREVRFRPSQPKEAWLREFEAHGGDGALLTLTREPKYDWPMLAVRVAQGEVRWHAPLLFSLLEPYSVVFSQPAREAGLKPGVELLDGLDVQGEVPPELAQLKGFAVDAVELTPSLRVQFALLEPEPGAPPHTPRGLLGADVWGRFVMTYDVDRALVLLRRPRVFVSGTRFKCERDGVTSAEACFDVHARVTGGQLAVTATVWSELPDGAQLLLDVEGGDGSCRPGLTFPPSDRGVSTHHRFPWPRTTDALPSCRGAFTGVTGASPASLEEVPLATCPGVCAFVRELVTGRLSCECQPGVRTEAGDAHRVLLRLFHGARRGELTPAEVEPEDP